MSETTITSAWTLGHPDRALRPVVYLDVDDTLFRSHEDSMVWFRNKPRTRRLFRPAPHAREFFQWAHANCDLRWLTYWAPYGFMSDGHVEYFTFLMDVSADDVLSVGGQQWAFMDGAAPLPGKCNGIAWAEHDAGRPWVWVEDDLPPDEIAYLRKRGAWPHFIRCNVTANRDAMTRAFAIVRRRLERACVAPITLAEAA